MADQAEMMAVFTALFKEIFPDFNGYHFPIRAKVLAVHAEGGRVAEFSKVYSVDVQPLSPDGSIDEDKPVIPDVEVPVIWAGPQRGVFCLPVKGALVRVGFYYNDPALPFVDAILADGFAIPEHALGSFIIQHSEGTRIEIDKDENVRITTPAKIEFTSGAHPIAFADVVKSVFDAHTHPTPCGESGSPSQKMTGHSSPQVFTG